MQSITARNTGGWVATSTGLSANAGAAVKASTALAAIRSWWRKGLSPGKPDCRATMRRGGVVRQSRRPLLALALASRDDHRGAMLRRAVILFVILGLAPGVWLRSLPLRLG